VARAPGGDRVSGFSVLVVGSELLSGKRRDGHLAFAIDALAARGLEVEQASFVGDDPPRITRALARAREDGDVLFSFGGIGATPDDHTRQCAADAAGVALVRHAQAAALIEERFGEGAYPQRILMAHLPEGATLIPNPVNRIAGFSLGHLHFVPGFPQMAWPMIEWVLDRHYAHRHGAGAVETLTTLPGVSEGQLIDVMTRFVAAHPGVRLSCLPHMDGDYRETELGVRGDGDEVAAAVRWLRCELDAASLPWSEGGR
jgi:molybdopterin-biosynthesis enzyme MoeA-like protein